MDDHASDTSKSNTRLVAAVIGLGLLASNMFWFVNYRFRTLMGDDIILLDASNTPNGYASRLLQSITQTGSQKYRPILTATLSVVLDLFGGDYLAYKLFNTVLFTIVCGLTALLAYRLSRGSLLMATFAGLAVVVSRFNLYYVLQVLGLMESLALAFGLLAVLAAEQAVSRKRRPYLYLMFAAYACAIYSHERYMLLVVFAAVVAYFAPMARTRRQRLVDTVAPFFVLLSNYVVKVWIFHVQFLTGGGGQSIEPNTSEIGWFSWRAALNVFGYNSGPAYLSGRNAHSLGFTPVVLSTMFALPALLLIGTAIVVTFRTSGWKHTSKVILVGGSLLGPLLLSAAITFRQEYRWLLGPYIVLLLAVAWALGVLREHVRLRVVAPVWLLVSTLVLGAYYAQYRDDTYFFAGQRVADSIEDRILNQHRDELATTTIFVVTHGDTTLTDWYLGNGAFFRTYAKNTPLDIRFVNELADATQGQGTRPTVLVFEYRYGDRVVQLP